MNKNVTTHWVYLNIVSYHLIISFCFFRKDKKQHKQIKVFQNFFRAQPFWIIYKDSFKALYKVI